MPGMLFLAGSKAAITLEQPQRSKILVFWIRKKYTQSVKKNTSTSAGILLDERDGFKIHTGDNFFPTII